MCEESVTALYYTNIASFHFAIGKPILSCFYSKPSLEGNKKTSLKQSKSTENSTSELS